MQFHNCSLEINFNKSFKVTEKDFQKLFADAVVAKPNFLAYDLDIDYEGIVGSTGVQVSHDKIADGSYSIKKVSESEYVIESNCKIDAEFMFMNEVGLKAFKKALTDGKLKVSICSVCNNGQNKKTYWSMECDPYMELSEKEFSFS